MGIGGGAVLFFADDGDGLAGGEFETNDRGRFFDVFALGDGVFGSAAAFAAFLDALELPLLLPENEVLLRLYFLGVVWLVVVFVTKFAGCGVCELRGGVLCGGPKNTCVPARIYWTCEFSGYYWSVATY